MEIKELKKEIDSLPDLNKVLSNFRKFWLKEIKKNTNPDFAFLQKLEEGAKKEINSYLKNCQEIWGELGYAQFINEKLSALAHYLLELKLTSLNGDKKKSKMIMKKFITDEFLSLKQLVEEVKNFELNLKKLRQVYDKVNQQILEEVSLEESVRLMDAPHKNYLNSLFLICRKQKRLLKSLGEEFIYLSREKERKNN